MGRKVFPRRRHVEFIVACDGFDGLAEIGRLALAPRSDGPVIDLERGIRHHEAFVEEQLLPQTVTGRTGPEGRVEGKQARLDFWDGEARHRTGEVFRERLTLRLAFFRRGLQNGDPVGEVERGAQAIRQPRFQPLAHDDPVDHHVDVVAELLVQNRGFLQLVEGSVHLDALETLLAKLLKLLAIFALAVAHDGGQQIGARALFHLHDPVDHVLHLLRLDG